MQPTIPPKLQQAWTRVKQVSARAWTDARAAVRQGWTRTREVSHKAWTGARKIAQQGWSGAATFSVQASARVAAELRRGWISFRDSWTKQDWLAGIKPLPPGMAGNLTAIAIVTGLVLTSLVYGDYYERQIEEARMLPSGEHPSQQKPPTTPEPDAAPSPAPVPEPAKPVEPEAAPAPSAASGLPQMGEAFVDRFDGDNFDERWNVSDGWDNGDWVDNDWRRSQLSFSDIGLTMTMERGPKDAKKPLKSAEIRTHAFYRYGYFETRMKLPTGPGIVAAAFTYAHTDGAVRPNEIDIEILGRETRVLEATIHENGKSTHKKIRMPFDSADGFHTYGFEWQPDFVAWYVDGKKMHEVRGGPAARLVRPQNFLISLLASTPAKAWLGKVDYTKAPWKLEVACVAYAPDYGGESLCK
jgi:endo-1,3-1,4-beta-glycanase ExoK